MKGVDKVLLLSVAVLLVVGLGMVYSASGVMALKKYGDSFYFLKKQILWVVIGLLAMAAAMRISVPTWNRLALPLLGVTSLLLVAVLIPGVGTEVNGSRRWLRAGPLTFQPSELAKLALVLYAAASLARKGPERIADFVYGFFPYTLVLGVFLSLIVFQPDFGTAVGIAIVMFTLLFIGGARVLHLSSFSVFLLPVIYKLVTGAGYRVERLKAFVNPWKDPTASGFQMVQSYLALGGGGLFGAGLGEGKQKLFFLPEAHTDFIFALIGEEMGFVGALAVLALFGVVIWRGSLIALRMIDPFPRLLAAGLTLVIGVQTFVNLGVVVGLLPTKGLPLPFVSFGGSAMLINLIAVGILLGLSRKPA